MSASCSGRAGQDPGSEGAVGGALQGVKPVKVMQRPTQIRKAKIWVSKMNTYFLSLCTEKAREPERNEQA